MKNCTTPKMLAQAQVGHGGLKVGSRGRYAEKYIDFFFSGCRHTSEDEVASGVESVILNS